MKRIITLALCLSLIPGVGAVAQNTGKDRLKDLEEKADEIKKHKKAKSDNDVFELNGVSYMGFGWSRVDGDAFSGRFGKSKQFFVNLLECSINPAPWLSISAGADLEWDYFELKKDNDFDVQADNSLTVIAAPAGIDWVKSVFRPVSFVVPAAVSFHIGDTSLKFGAEAMFNVDNWNVVRNRHNVGKSQYRVKTKGGEVEKCVLRYHAAVDFDGLGVFYKYCPESIIPGSDIIKGYHTIGILLSL